MTRGDSPTGACLTTDVVDSRLLADRGGVQAEVEAALARVNEAHARTLQVPLAFTLGDEWQGLTTNVAAALVVDFELRHSLHPLKLASGIGAGKIATAMKTRTVEMDGECFHRSRDWPDGLPFVQIIGCIANFRFI